MIKENTKCLACGSNNLRASLNLGTQPLANSFKKNKTEQQSHYPLGLYLCNVCFHLQLTHTVDPSIIYQNYLYVSGTSKTLKDYSNWFAAYVDETIERKSYNVLDIGCNDGTQLDSFKTLGYNTFGVDPAKNIFPISSKNHNVICDYFNDSLVETLNNEFDAIIAQNVFAHNPEPFQFLTNCKRLMSDHTLLFIQTSQADMVLNNEFDTIYHEHVNFFNINSMKHLADRVGINLIDAFKSPIHGNSYVFVFSKTLNRDYNIYNKIQMEKELLSTSKYDKWENTVHANMLILQNTLLKYKDDGYKLIGYGAAAKGNTLLNFGNINLDLILDDNPLKQNTFTPGMSIEVTDTKILDSFNEEDKILFVPLAWNFFSEIKSKIKSSRNNPNDRFLKYFPVVEVYDV